VIGAAATVADLAARSGTGLLGAQGLAGVVRRASVRLRRVVAAEVAVVAAARLGVAVDQPAAAVADLPARGLDGGAARDARGAVGGRARRGGALVRRDHAAALPVGTAAALDGAAAAVALDAALLAL